VISRHVEAALRRAGYDKLEDVTFYGKVRGLRGVLSTGETLEECRNQLADVVEEWVLVAVAKGLSVPRLGKIAIRVKTAG
jgi:predicted RNase H-like HicB family nuclease